MQKSILIITTAFLIGLVANSLFGDWVQTGVPVGLAVPLFTQLLACATIFLAFRTNMPLGRKGLYFLIPATVFSLGFIFRDSPTLLAIDMGVIFLSLAFTAMSLTGIRLTSSGISTYLTSVLNGLLFPLLNAGDLLYSFVDWNNILPQNISTHMRAVSRGLAIGVPLTGLFLGLFVSADPAFAAIVGKSVHLNIQETFVSAVVIGVTTWLTTGFLHTFALSKISQENSLTTVAGGSTPIEKPPGTRLGITELTVVLSLMNLLFAAFVAVQLKFLFGGASLVGLTPGLTYAEYARKGFFDLNFAVALVLPILLWADHLLAERTKIPTMILRSLSATLLALLSVVMASALMRMHLYQAEYGMSELRLYTTAFMGWLGLVGVIFAGTVLVGRRERFAFASFCAGLTVITGLHLINPDATIERNNISHAKSGLAFDVNYALSLSNDAVPTLVKNIDGLPREEQRLIAGALVGQHAGAWKTDWRALNLSRISAYRAVNDNREKLTKLAAK